jgi:hypothetical protein
MPTLLDQARMRRAKDVLSRSDDLPTRELKIKQLDRLGRALAAMQSMDDLGAVSENNQAMRDCDELIGRIRKLEDEIAAGTGQGVAGPAP